MCSVLTDLEFLHVVGHGVQLLPVLVPVPRGRTQDITDITFTQQEHHCSSANREFASYFVQYSTVLILADVLTVKYTLQRNE
jgi:hypothetical protein